MPHGIENLYILSLNSILNRYMPDDTKTGREKEREQEYQRKEAERQAEEYNLQWAKEHPEEVEKMSENARQSVRHLTTEASATQVLGAYLGIPA